MVLEKQILPFWEWLAGGLPVFGAVMLALLVGGALFGFLVTSLRDGPAAALTSVFGTIATGIRELFEMSPRRVYAMTSLAFREAVRRKVLVVFGVFMALLLFAGWFLDPGADHPARLYLSFVLTATNFLILMLAVFLSTFSLPNDVKSRTIYTVVTKPVRSWEIVLGRILGFSAIGTLLLLVMGIFSYVFVVRGLSHTHEVEQLTDVEAEVGGAMTTIQEGQSSRQQQHRHDVRILPDGEVRVESNHDHWHEATSQGGKVTMSSSVGALQARVPQYGKLIFHDSEGKIVSRGVNVGNEWDYRSFIEGGTLATAIYTFDGLNRTDFKDGIPLEMMIRVFRTYKGEIERGIFGSIQVVEPDLAPPDGQVRLAERRNRYAKINFTAREFSADSHVIPFSAPGIDADGNEREMLLFEDIVKDGKLELWIQCGERAQYFGVAQGDVYIRAADGFFWANFIKGFLGIWFQMIIATSFAVMFSTFLTGSVAMLATVAAIFLGFVANFVMGLRTGDVEGGGPVEAMVRVISQKNMTIELEPGVTTSIIKGLDFVTTLVMAGFCTLLPDYGGFNNSDYVAYGFDINNSLMIRHLLVTLLYVGALTTAGYFFLKTREIAA